MNTMHARQTGQGLAEYALLLVLLGIAAILIVGTFGADLQNTYCQIAANLGEGLACGNYFADDFANLSAWNIVRGSWQVLGGDLVGGPNEGRIFHDLGQSDYVITVEGATLKRGNGYGIFFRATNPSRVNGYTFQYDPGYRGGAFILRKWVNGNELPPFAVAPARGYDWNASSRQVNVVVKGNTFTAYVDGVQVVRGTDSTYTQGGIGFRTWDGTIAHFGGVSVDPVR